MNLATARESVRQFARNAGDSSMYSDPMIDRAIQFVCTRFCRITRHLLTTSTLSLTASSYSLPTLPTGFLPRRIVAAWIEGYPQLQIVGHDAIVAKRAAYTGTVTPPRLLAFTSTTTGEVWPTPSANATLNIQWWQAFTTWTPGVDGNTITLNLPDEVLVEILPLGPTAILQHNEPEHAYASGSWKQYLDVERSYLGGGGMGATAVLRFTVDDVAAEAEQYGI